VRRAILLVLIGGWWLLPVARYPSIAPGTGFPWWVTGIALPSDMLLTKAWLPPLVAFAGAVIRDWRTFVRWRPGVIDLPMLGWCLWPLVNGLGAAANPPGWVSSLYLIGAWVLPWVIGRIWLAGDDGRLALLKALALSGLASIPVAIIEGVRGPVLYRLLYGPHPFQFDGIERYAGYRPLGFFENGNLYGLWAALAGFAALWLARVRFRGSSSWLGVAILNLLVLLASQSVGAIVLVGVGIALLLLWRSPIFLPLVAASGALMIAVMAVHLSGIVPLQSIAHSPAGEKAIGAMRSIGRGSFLWRVSQDSKTLATVAAHPIAGTAQWDWWRAYGTRPWGQLLLLVGQFGLVGLALAWGSLLSACAATFARLRGAATDPMRHPSAPLAILVLLTLFDALLNAFFFAPALLAAGAIAASVPATRTAALT
jgi:hypothetical protein